EEEPRKIRKLEDKIRELNQQLRELRMSYGKPNVTGEYNTRRPKTPTEGNNRGASNCNISKLCRRVMMMNKREAAGAGSTEDKTEKRANELTVISMEKQKTTNEGESQLANENVIAYPPPEPLVGNLC
ncbi:16206_t:CDS:2, partial [Acaulospora morrowiae]